MATTVIAAFDEFLKHNVNLEKDVNDLAKSSRDWLINRINGFSGAEDFVTLYPDIHMPFGSFARRTKIPTLDDIDLMIGMAGNGCTYNAIGGWNNVLIYVPETNKDFYGLCHDGTDMLNSRKVINRFVTKLAEVPQYRKADIKRNGEACILDLTSYTWKYDIVPCFITELDTNNKTFYIIPNGQGNWMMTDPRIDKEYTDGINQKHDGNALQLVRIMKFWIKRQGVSAIKSYLLETMVLQFLTNKSSAISKFVDVTLPELFDYMSKAVHYTIPDPKRIIADLNNLGSFERIQLAISASNDAVIATEACRLEEAKDMAGSIREWRKIFGPSFPTYS